MEEEKLVILFGQDYREHIRREFKKWKTSSQTSGTLSRIG